MKHHARRFRRLHTRYTLIILNAIALAGLVTYGLTVRAADAATDTAVLHTMMDADTAQPFNLLMPPEVK